MNGYNSENLEWSLAYLGESLAKQLKWSRAEPVWRETLELRQRRLGGEDLLVATAQRELAAVLMKRTKAKEAEPLIRAALATRQKLLSETDARIASVLYELVQCLADQEKWAEAIEQARASVAARLKSDGDASKSTASAYRQLGWYLANAPDAAHRQPDEAVTWLERAAEIDPQNRYSWLNLGAAFVRLNRPDDAVAALEKSIELAGKPMLWDLQFLAMAHSLRGDAPAARQTFAEAEAQIKQMKQPSRLTRQFQSEAAAHIANLNK
jgi:tetratricopeptide (TPR) repeat protein